MDRAILGKSAQTTNPIYDTPKISLMDKELPVPTQDDGASQVSEEYFDALPRHDSATTESPAEDQGSHGLLDVAIPKHAMERYSVMFEGLLKPRLTLLERRNGTLKRLRPVDEGKVCRFHAV